jgi:hypothetical protein
VVKASLLGRCKLLVLDWLGVVSGSRRIVLLDGVVTADSTINVLSSSAGATRPSGSKWTDGRRRNVGVTWARLFAFWLLLVLGSGSCRREGYDVIKSGGFQKTKCDDLCELCV